MNAELTVSMEQTLIEQAQKYATANNMSMAELLGEYFCALKNQQTHALNIASSLTLTPKLNDRSKNNELRDKHSKLSKITGTALTYQQILDNDPKPTPFTDSITGILKKFDDGRDYQEIINEEREKRMAKYL